MKRSHPNIIKDQRGQIIVEYVLLIVVAVALALIIVGQMVSRNPDDPGFLIDKWNQLNQVIGSDVASGNSESDDVPDDN